MGFIEDIHAGVMDRMLVAPVWRGALNAGTVVYAALIARTASPSFARQREALIGAVTLVLLPLTFLSTALMQENLVPGWIRTVARFNPVNRAVEAARSAAMQQIDWGLVGSRIGLLAAVTLLSAAFATRAFTKYQRSL